MFPVLELTQAEAGAFAHGQAPRRSALELREFAERCGGRDTASTCVPIAAINGEGEVVGLLEIRDSRLKTILVF